MKLLTGDIRGIGARLLLAPLLLINLVAFQNCRFAFYPANSARTAAAGTSSVDGRGPASPISPGNNPAGANPQNSMTLEPPEPTAADLNHKQWVLGPVECDGTYRNYSYALDYNKPTWIRKGSIKVVKTNPAQFSIVTFCNDDPGPTVEGQYTIVAVTGQTGAAHVDYGIHGKKVPAGQALALEWSCMGGGQQWIVLNIDYSEQAP